MADPITVGATASDRGDKLSAGFTILNSAYPANDTGKITSVEIWIAAESNNMTNCKVGSFFSTGGEDFNMRDEYAIGNVTKGSKQTFPVSFNIEAGDVIGIYGEGGDIERDTTGGDGIHIKNGDHFGSNETYTPLADDVVSLYGTGETVSVGGNAQIINNYYY